ncbi:hypothetical protein CCACVL1_03489 [Corchorus capsularis]|uniref:Uncharacterized protein n=1 Tax=Corchorus capsularis TaxID=210143 RepID=A0A1R3JYX9_COCAP|nr:hypothetical protein CCACVL1_03489 [Corchorus capsularis]
MASDFAEEEGRVECRVWFWALPFWRI